MNEIKQAILLLERIRRVLFTPGYTEDSILSGELDDMIYILCHLEAREAKKTVPMAMLNNAYSVGMDYGRGLADCDRNALKDIAARYGYEVIE